MFELTNKQYNSSCFALLWYITHILIISWILNKCHKKYVFLVYKCDYTCSVQIRDGKFYEVKSRHTYKAYFKNFIMKYLFVTY